MRARIFSIIILIVLVVIPFYLYYYFTTQKIASITLFAGSGVIFNAQLSWSFWVDWLPLADKALSYTKDCVTTCTISPILPARYTISLTSSGKASISDALIVNSGDKIARTYSFENDVTFVSLWNINRDDELWVSFVENAINQGIGEFDLIGTDIQSRVWVMKKWEKSTQIGILTLERFNIIRNINSPITEARLDESRSVLICIFMSWKTLLLPINLVWEREILTMPWIRTVSIGYNNEWKIRTSTGSFSLRWDRLLDDIRFTDSIDISPQVRIGYIDKSDTLKLSLGNFPSATSVLVRLNRATGESVVLRKWFDIRALFFYKNEPVYMDDLGNIYSIVGE